MVYSTQTRALHSYIRPKRTGGSWHIWLKHIISQNKKTNFHLYSTISFTNDKSKLKSYSHSWAIWRRYFDLLAWNPEYAYIYKKKYIRRNVLFSKFQEHKILDCYTIDEDLNFIYKQKLQITCETRNYSFSGNNSSKTNYVLCY